MQTHNWMQKGYVNGGFMEGINCVTVVQEYKCTRCGETIALPDCHHNNGKQRSTCKSLMSLGCEGKMPERIKWKAPMPKKEASDVNKRDYPAKKTKKAR